MSTEIIQVRDVPSDDLAVLRQRAAARGVSLSAYLREVIHNETARPEMSEVLDRISRREHVEVSTEDVRSFIEAGRR